MEQEGEGQAKGAGRVAAVAGQLRKSAFPFQVASSTLTNIMPAAMKITISTVGIRSRIRNFDILSKQSAILHCWYN
jgi:hypothetical protein